MNTSTPEKRGPGRPRKEQRRRRNVDAMGDAHMNLQVNPDLIDKERYAYRWLNDEQNGRLHTKTKLDDWEMVPNEGVKEDSTDLGDMVSIYVGTHKDGSPKRAYLVRKPKTYFDEDEAEKQSMLDRQLTGLRAGNDSAGKQQSDYVPSTGITISR